MNFSSLLGASRRKSSVVFLSGSAVLIHSAVNVGSPGPSAAALADGRTSDTEARRHCSQRKLFRGECSEHLVRKPRVPYPAWDHNWDGRATATADPKSAARSPKVEKTRHILLIRHGQYEMGLSDDSQRVLTPLGRRQAELTGKRLAKLVAANVNFGLADDTYSVPCRIKAIHVSGMARAKETASIIVTQLEGYGLLVAEPDPSLNEALPAPIIPSRPDVGSPTEQEEEIAKNQDRIEAAFLKYIHRADPSDDVADDDGSEHEFEVVVCHANIIRYFLMRGLQLPPEAWLRLSLFNCSITYLMVQPNGYVTARLVGDTGHIPYEETTFSGAFGYNWKTPTSA